MNANSINIGNVIKHNNKFWLVTKKEHVKPGKGGAFVQVEMKDIINNTKLNERFRSTAEVEKAFLEEKTFNYQYDDRDNLVLMNTETYEQEFFPKTLLGNRTAFLQEGMDVTVSFCEGMAIDIKLPETVVLAITTTEPTIKGQTATNSFKPAILENGIRVMVPPFISSEDKIVVRTEDGTYVERAK